MKKVYLTVVFGLLALCFQGTANAQTPIRTGSSLANVTMFEIGPRAAQQFTNLRALTWKSTDGAVPPIVEPNTCASCCENVWDGYCSECGHGGCSPRCHDKGQNDCGCSGGCDGGCDADVCSSCGKRGCHGGCGLLGRFFGGGLSHSARSCGCNDCGCSASATSSGESLTPWSSDGVAPPEAPMLPTNELPNSSTPTVERQTCRSIFARWNPAERRGRRGPWTCCCNLR